MQNFDLEKSKIDAQKEKLWLESKDLEKWGVKKDELKHGLEEVLTDKKTAFLYMLSEETKEVQKKEDIIWFLAYKE